METQKFKYQVCPKPMYVPSRNLETQRIGLYIAGGCNDYINCKTCADKKRRKTWIKSIKKIEELDNDLKKGEKLQYLTLTMDLGGLSLEEGFEKFNIALTKLRGRKLWKERVSGYIGSKELGKNSIHIHLVISARYISKEKLKAAWEDLTGCREIKLLTVGKSSDDRRRLASYLSKGLEGEFKEEFSKLREKKKIRLLASSLKKRSILDNIAITHDRKISYWPQIHVYYGKYKKKSDAIEAIRRIKQHLA